MQKFSIELSHKFKMYLKLKYPHVESDDWLQIILLSGIHTEEKTRMAKIGLSTSIPIVVGITKYLDVPEDIANKYNIDTRVKMKGDENGWAFNIKMEK